jgi:hypothetical protein
MRSKNAGLTKCKTPARKNNNAGPNTAVGVMEV